MEEKEPSVKIAIRERPLEDAENETIIERHDENEHIISVQGKFFAFDQVFFPDASNEQVYAALIRPQVEKLIQGYNCASLAYGQTGTGKTYSMGLHESHDEKDAGMIYRALQDTFELLKENLDESKEVTISFIEIYKEKVYDLMSLGGEVAKGFKGYNSTRVPVEGPAAAQTLLMVGSRFRHVRPTKLNSQSSRSHAIFTIHVTVKKETTTTISALHLVDLAGSEGVKKTGHQGTAFSEGVNINQGLLVVGKVLQALSVGSAVVPYRDSLLTTVLQETLNPNSFITLLVCISPLSADVSETLSTLRFADNARSLKTTPRINSIINEIIKNKTPTKTPLKVANNRFNTPGNTKRRPFSTGLSTIKKAPFANNTFCTPNKTARLDARPMNSTVLDGGGAQAIKDFFNPDNFRNSIESRPSSVFNMSTSSMLEPPKTSDSPMVRRIVAMLEATIDDKLQKLQEKLQETLSQTQVPAATQESVFPYEEIRQELHTLIRAEVSMAIQQQQMPLERPDSPELQIPELGIVSTVRKAQPGPSGNRFTEEGDITVLPRSSDESTIDDTVIYTRKPLALPAPRPLLSRTELTTMTLPQQSSSADDTVINPEKSFVFTVPGPRPLPIDPISRPSLVPDAPTRRSARISHRFSLLPNPPPPEPQKLEKPNDQKNVCQNFRIVLKKSPTTEPATAKKKKPAPKIRKEVLAEYFEAQSTNAGPGLTKKKHKKAILELLNEGNLKELQVLPQIGLKTAYQLVTQRSLNGRFKNLNQVSKLPIWRGKAWERFMKANSLE